MEVRVNIEGHGTYLVDASKVNELIITGSSGLAVEVFYSTFVNKTGQRIFLTSGLGSMGYGLPAAIGGCLASGRKPVVSVEGDGSLQLNLQELSTLKSLNLPIRMFVMNNNGYASIRNTQRNYFDARYVATGQEAGLLIPDLVKLAEAIGLDVLSDDAAGNVLDVALAGVQALDLPGVDVETDHGEFSGAEFTHQGQTDVAETDDADLGLA